MRRIVERNRLRRAGGYNVTVVGVKAQMKHCRITSANQRVEQHWHVSLANKIANRALIYF
jgi:hypothetical protein